MTVEQNKKEVIFRIPRSVKIEDLQELADLFEFKQIATKSKASQRELDILLKAGRKGRWSKIKNQVGL
ncbi:MAG: hypothetical protein RL660_1521 [Bacteroidota bacterium]|jgi:hypothetical protein